MIAEGAIHLTKKSCRLSVGAARRIRPGKAVSALTAVAMALALIAATPRTAQAQNFQGSASSAYPYGVTIPTLPTMYMAQKSFAKVVNDAGHKAIEAIKNCNRAAFDNDIAVLRRNLAILGLDVRDSRAQDAANHGAAPSLGFGEILHGAFSVFAFGEDPYVHINNPEPYDSKNTRELISDANTIASVINFLLQKSWAHCNPPPPPPPPPHAAPKPTQTGYRPGQGLQYLRQWQAYVNGQLGGFARTTTFDDGGKLHSGAGLFQGNVGLQFPIAPNVFIAPQVGIGVPFSGVTNGAFSTRLQVFGTGEVLLGTTLPIPATSPLPPITIFGGGGGAIGSVNSSSTFPGFSYSSTQTLGGFTLSGGASVPIMDNASLLANFRYLNLGFESFPTPAGNFRQREEAFIGTLGVQVMLSPLLPAPAP